MGAAVVTEDEDQQTRDFEQEARKSNGENSAAAAALAKADDRSIHEWISNIGSTASMRVKITRTFPRIWKQRQIGGVIEFVDEAIDELWLQERHGGGKYQIQVQKVNAKGGWSYAGSKIIEISGDPILKNVTRADDSGDAMASNTAPAEDTSVLKAAMSMTERMTVDAQRRAEKIEDEMRAMSNNPKGTDPVIVELLRGAQSEARELRKQMHDTLTAPKTTTATDDLLKTMVAGDTDRTARLREMHESELRTLRAQAADDVKRSEDRLQRLMDAQERGHEREIASLRSSADQNVKMLEISYTTQVKTLEGQLTNLRSDHDAVRKELAELRGRKDKSTADQLQEIVQLKDLMGALGGDEPEEPVWKQVVQAIGENPMVQGLGQRIAEGPPQREPSPAAARAQAIARARAAQAAKEAAGEAAGAGVGTSAPGAGAGSPKKLKAPIKVDPAEARTAVTFLEQALGNGTSPEAFVESAKMLVPRAIVEAIRVEGIDSFLARVAKVPDGSPLTTIAGRNFVRKVAKLLVGEGEG